MGRPQRIVSLSKWSSVFQYGVLARALGLIWFIGTQDLVGPTDEEKWSPAPPMSTIEMKHIRARHINEIMSIPGVQRFDIGTKGFTVEILLPWKENRTLIPRVLEGIPVEVKITEDMYGYGDARG